MEVSIGGVTSQYQKNFEGGAERAVVLLHGWGGGLSSFGGVYASLTDLGIKAVNLAFPSDVPGGWGIYDYAAHCSAALDSLGLKEPTVVGHSFGGRVGLILAAERRCGRLVLVDSAGMEPRHRLIRRLRVARYRYLVKHGKPLDGTGSVDYNSLSKEKRAVFVRVVNTHLERLLRYIVCPTLIIWGRRDRDTPPYMARRLHRGIKGSRLVYIDGGHYSYIDSDFRFLALLKNFIDGKG